MYPQAVSQLAYINIIAIPQKDIQYHDVLRVSSFILNTEQSLIIQINHNYDETSQ